MAQPKSAAQTFIVADLDPYARQVTSGVAYLGGLLALPLLFAYLAGLRWDGLTVPTALALALAVFLFFSYAGQARRLRIEAQQLVIERAVGPAIRLPYREISAVTAVAGMDDLMKRGTRWRFNAGVFGYQGPFSLAPYGRLNMLATDLTRLVAIARPGLPPLLISPQAPRAFVEALNLARAEAATAELKKPEGA
jgi:hypothetical protein